MKYTKLGKSGIDISCICLGCMGFGIAGNGQHSWTLDEDSSRKIIKRALELGINFYDTAIVYQNGTSEQFLGRAIRDFARRDEVVIATKFLPRTPDEIAAGISGQQHVSHMLDKSLKNLGMDYVDLYICHMWDYHTPIEEIMEGMHNAVQAGKVRAIGISNCYAWQLAKANALAEKKGWNQFVSVQGHYNLLFREEEREMAPLCAEDGISMTPYSPLASGRLAKPRTEITKRLQEDSYAKGKYDLTSVQDAVIINRVAELAEKRNLTRTQIALGWLLGKAAVPIVGATKLQHIDDAACAADVVLSEQETAYLEEMYLPHKLVGVMKDNHK